MGNLFSVILFLFIGFLIFGNHINNVRKAEFDRMYNNEAGIRIGTIIDTTHKTIHCYKTQVRELLSKGYDIDISDDEEENMINEVEVWLSSDKKYLFFHPLGIDRTFKIDSNNILGIKLKQSLQSVEIPQIPQKPKGGFDTGGAILGGLIAGTPGAIVGGMHGMGKETGPQSHEYKTITNKTYFLEFSCNDEIKYELAIQKDDVKTLRQLFKNK